MPRSPFARALRRLHRRYQRRVLPAEPRSATRTEFLLGAAASLASLASSPVPKASRRIAIIGGGVAGLTCAYRLHQAGYPSTVYEASSRIGGRTWTLRNYFAAGQIAEHGAEFIASDHVQALALARELGLALVNGDDEQPAGVQGIAYFNSTRYTNDQVDVDYKPVYTAIARDADDADYPTKYDNVTSGALRLDSMSVDDWIAANVPGGLKSRLGQLLSVTCTIEYGGDAAQQSALNLINLLAYIPESQFGLDSEDDGFQVVGGIDLIAARLGAALPSGTVQLGTALVALRRHSDGTYRCTFQDGSELNADHVVLALPFSTLRQVDTSGVSFSAVKRLAIEKQKMGTNAKLAVQFSSSYWNSLHLDGSTYSQFAYQNSWETTRAQQGDQGILVGFPGGKRGLFPEAPAHGPAPVPLIRRFLADLEPLFPGITSRWTGAAYLDVWANDPWHLGSYPYYGIGDYTTFAGAQGLRESNVHFCGDHTSYDFQGYVNGAVRSGERVASEISGLRTPAPASPHRGHG